MSPESIDVSVLPGFLVVVILICLAPGPDMAYMAATGISGGRAAATRAALGVTAGVLVYVVAVAAGLGGLLAAHKAVLTAVQVFGAVYLGRLAYMAVIQARRSDFTAAGSVREDWFRRGLITNLTNPKAILFFLALLPQFLGKAHSPALQFLMLGLTFQLVGLVGDLAIGWAAGAFRDRVLTRPKALQAMALVSAAVFAVLAVVVGIEAIRSMTR